MSAALTCAHAAPCGGCPLIHLPYDAQLERKRARVGGCMRRYGALASVPVAPVVAAEPASGYRTRAKVMVGPDGRVGLFGVAGDHEVVDTPGCIVLSPVVARVLAALRARIAEALEGGPLRPRGARGDGGLVAIDVRELVPGDGSPARALVTLVVVRGPGFALERLRAVATDLQRAVPEVLGVAVNLREQGSRESPQVLGPETLLLAGQASGVDTIGSTAHRATFGSFVQAHRGQAARVHAAIAAALLGDAAEGPPPRVLDLYGGSGAIALALVSRGAAVHLVESFPPAVDQARESARAAGLRLTADCRDVAVALEDLGRVAGRFDAAVVNPPRRGLDPLVRAGLARLGLGRIVYVSCQPETLARDLDHLARLGYAPGRLVPFDMIPLTEEVETLAVLERTSPAPPVVLFEDAEVVVVDKPPHEPTTPQGEHAGSLLARVQALAGARDAVAVHRLDVGTSGAVIFARDASRAGAWSAALQRGGSEGGGKVYLAAVRGDPGERGVVDRPLGIAGKSKPARTRFERVRVLRDGDARAHAHTLVRVAPEEGRTHQIRRHLAAIGHPVLGDARYGHAATNRFFLEKHGLDRTFLHAARIELTHPSTGRRLVLEAPLPGDLASVLDSAAR